MMFEDHTQRAQPQLNTGADPPKKLSEDPAFWRLVEELEHRYGLEAPAIDNRTSTL